jgi:hypothetical protein
MRVKTASSKWRHQFLTTVFFYAIDFHTLFAQSNKILETFEKNGMELLNFNIANTHLSA